MIHQSFQLANMFRWPTTQGPQGQVGTSSGRQACQPMQGKFDLHSGQGFWLKYSSSASRHSDIRASSLVIRSWPDASCESKVSLILTLGLTPTGKRTHKKGPGRPKASRADELKRQNEQMRADIGRADSEIGALSQNLQARVSSSP